MSHPSLQKYSRYVSLMKVLLPLGIILILGFSIGGPYILSSYDHQEVALLDTSQPDIQENRMTHPEYVSTDNKEQPYQVKAEWAKQRTEHLADLKNPEGSLTMTKGETLNVSATKGAYDTQGKNLELSGNVTLTSTDGYQVKTEKANVSLDSKIIEGNMPIQGEGPKGSLQGQDGFRIEIKGKQKVITLKGPSRVVINAAGS